MIPTEDGAYISLAERRREHLEKYLQSRKGYTKKQLLKLLADDLADVRDAAEISLRTLNYDLKYLEKLGAEITKDPRKAKNKAGRTITEYYYSYTNPKWSYKKHQIDPDSLASVKVAVAILKQIPGIQLHEDLKEIYESLVHHADTIADERPYILFDQRQGISGLQHIPKLLQAVIDRGVVVFDYRSFTSEQAVTETVSPYLLKEYKSRWYLIGHSDAKNELQHYGLDRIVSRKVTVDNTRQFVPAPDFNPVEYFKHVIGVSVIKGAQPQKVAIKVNKPRAYHLDNAPLHHSQTLVNENETSKTYQLHLVPNFELETIFLSYGADLEVLEPIDLKNKVASLIKDAGKKYF